MTRRRLPIAAAANPDGRPQSSADRIDGPSDGATGAAASADTARPDLRDEDLHALLVAFYDRVIPDPLLAPYFAGLDMPAHIPRIADFWSTMLFHTGRYSGNAFAPHLAMPGLDAPHFARWLAHFEATVDARFAGPSAALAKSLAHRIAFSMQLRLGVSP